MPKYGIISVIEPATPLNNAHPGGTFLCPKINMANCQDSPCLGVFHRGQVAHISVIIALGGDWVKRVNLYITDEQEKWLNEQNQKLGLSGKSELVRRILDKEMKKK